MIRLIRNFKKNYKIRILPSSVVWAKQHLQPVMFIAMHIGYFERTKLFLFAYIYNQR